MKKHIPYKLKRSIKQTYRWMQDVITGRMYKFSKRRKVELVPHNSIELSQPIFSTTLSENKIHNLKIATTEIEQYIILPNEIFSFWNILGNPSAAKGYKKGRNLIGGILSEDEGGGLCQLSGIIYHAAIIAGLEILERYPHSKDIYTEQNRFTPLGSDAAVVYGYKDLRILNNTNAQLFFRFKIEPDKFTCILFSTEPLVQRKVLFERVNEQTVITKFEKEGNWIELEKSVYEK